MKKCPTCELVLCKNEFSSNPARGDGLASHCRACSVIISKAFYNPKKKANYYKKNIKRIAQYKKNFYQLFRKKLINDPDLKEKKKIADRIGWLRKEYGLSVETYNHMVDAQKNRCKICHTKFTKVPCVDHCHKTGKVRGLLCRACNVGLGAFRDTEKLFLRAIKYLKESK